MERRHPQGVEPFSQKQQESQTVECDFSDVTAALTTQQHTVEWNVASGSGRVAPLRSAVQGSLQKTEKIVLQGLPRLSSKDGP